MFPFIFHPSLVLIIIDLTVVSRIGITVKMNFDYDESMDQIFENLSILKRSESIFVPSKKRKEIVFASNSEIYVIHIHSYWAL